MRYFLRLALSSAVGFLAAGAIAYAAPAAQRVSATQAPAPEAVQPSEGYLGIVCGDVTDQSAAALKLKTVSGAEIINVDRDAPAGKIGLRPHDVILQMNGQTVAGEEQLRRMLRETPAGRTVSLLISRDGQQQTLSVTLANRAILEQNTWSQPMMIPAPEDGDTYVLQGPSGHSVGSGFFGAIALGSPTVGVELDALGTQLANYFGIKDGQGLLVKRVAENSPASRAGLQAGDVITRANGQKMATLGEWMKMIHANRGKRIPITLIRNRKQQTLTLNTKARKHHSQLVGPGWFSFPGGFRTSFAWISFEPSFQPR